MIAEGDEQGSEMMDAAKCLWVHPEGSEVLRRKSFYSVRDVCEQCFLTDEEGPESIVRLWTDLKKSFLN